MKTMNGNLFALCTTRFKTFLLFGRRLLLCKAGVGGGGDFKKPSDKNNLDLKAFKNS